MSDKDDRIFTGVDSGDDLPPIDPTAHRYTFRRRRTIDGSKPMEPWQFWLVTALLILAFTYFANSMYALYQLHEAEEDAQQAMASFQQSMADADARAARAVRQAEVQRILDQNRQEQSEAVARAQAQQRQIAEAKKEQDWRRCMELKAIAPARQSLADHAAMAQSCANVGVPFD